jgi:hypothetical protein
LSEVKGEREEKESEDVRIGPPARKKAEQELRRSSLVLHHLGTKTAEERGDVDTVLGVVDLGAVISDPHPCTPASQSSTRVWRGEQGRTEVGAGRNETHHDGLRGANVEELLSVKLSQKRC